MEIFPNLVSGILLGFAAGVSPGPLLALVISETLTHGRREGMLVSMVPALTDVPIIAVSIFIISKISGSDSLLGMISLAGAFFVGHLAYRNMTLRDVNAQLGSDKSRSLSRGLITNFLSPYPYLFWMTVGAPTVIKAFDVSFPAALAFLAGFYGLLIGSKVLIALLVSSSRNFLRGRAYIIVIRATGIIMLVFAVLFLRDGMIMLRLVE